jgi:D-alanyl-D-alanine carboxypeptidase (penicillin-binding protein 5/6)
MTTHYRRDRALLAHRWGVGVSVLVLSTSILSAAYARDAAEPFAARMLLDAETGTVLFESEPHRPWPPASMVKMMVVLLTMERVADGRLTLDDDVRASAWASRMGGSQVYLKEGEVFPLRDMLRAVVIASANDASAAIAEHIAGSTGAFVDLMNARAKELGLTDTVYRSVHGLPEKAAGDDDVTSAADLARVARELLKYDDVVAWASTPQALFRNGTFQLTNTNHLINRYAGANGMKTGYHRRSGFGVTATAARDDFTLVAVVLGARVRRECFAEAARLLTHGFASYRVVNAVRQGQPIGTVVPVEGGETDEVLALAQGDLRIIVPRKADMNPQVEARLPRLVNAPVQKGQRLGEAVIVKGEEVLGRTDLVADRDIAAVGWLGWWRSWWSAAGAAP